MSTTEFKFNSLENLHNNFDNCLIQNPSKYICENHIHLPMAEKFLHAIFVFGAVQKFLSKCVFTITGNKINYKLFTEYKFPHFGPLSLNAHNCGSIFATCTIILIVISVNEEKCSMLIALRKRLCSAFFL